MLRGNEVSNRKKGAAEKTNGTVVDVKDKF